MDDAELATVCLQVAKPMKKVVRKTFEEAVFLVSCLLLYACDVFINIAFGFVFITERISTTAH